MTAEDITAFVQKHMHSDYDKEYIQQEAEKLFKLAYNMGVQKVYDKADYWIDGEPHISAEEILRLRL